MCRVVGSWSLHCLIRSTLRPKKRRRLMKILMTVTVERGYDAWRAPFYGDAPRRAAAGVWDESRITVARVEDHTGLVVANDANVEKLKAMLATPEFAVSRDEYGLMHTFPPLEIRCSSATRGWSCHGETTRSVFQSPSERGYARRCSGTLTPANARVSPCPGTVR